MGENGNEIKKSTEHDVDDGSQRRGKHTAHTAVWGGTCISKIN